MLAEHTERNTPEDKKKAKAARIKEDAKVLYATLALAPFSTMLRKAQDVTLAGQHEAIRAEFIQGCQVAAAQAINAVETFDEVWKEKKGKFLA